MTELSEMTSSPRERLILPFLGPFYHGFAQPVGWAVFRVIIGGLLMVEGWPKIIAPMAQVDFVENVLGLPAGWFFSPLLAVIQFFGGFLKLLVGLVQFPGTLRDPGFKAGVERRQGGLGPLAPQTVDHQTEHKQRFGDHDGKPAQNVKLMIFPKRFFTKKPLAYCEAPP